MPAYLIDLPENITKEKMEAINQLANAVEEFLKLHWKPFGMYNPTEVVDLHDALTEFKNCG